MRKHLIAISTLLILAGCQTVSGPYGAFEFPERRTLASDQYAVTKSTEISVVYISAWNCPPCWRYKEQAHPIWLKSKEYNYVQFRELEFPSYQYTGDDKYWPAALRWIRTKTYSMRGAPRWIVLADRKIISNQKSWTQTYRLIQHVVARKLET